MSTSDPAATVNSRLWWETYHTEHWEKNNGPSQTRYFMQRLVGNLPAEETSYLVSKGATALDWGCAFGDGVEVLARSFPKCRVSGLDFSQTAIAEARQAFPQREFLHAEDGEIPRRFDVIVTSACLEHFDDPLAVARTHLRSCRDFYVVLVPYREESLCESHRSRFGEDSFPEQLDGFSRVSSTAINADPAFWNGRLLLVVYASQSYLKTRTSRVEEQQKWDSLYASLPLQEVDDYVKQFGDDLAQHVSELLPDGGRVLEAGCGAGWQTMALARNEKFRCTLMDFSSEALNYAQRCFARESIEAVFVYGDVFAPGEPEYDLVFNAGVLEHYAFEEQVAFLRGMASRSRKYVLAIVPNRLCYWYWIRRVHAAAHGQWPVGKEVPATDLSAAFQAAGLNYLGQWCGGTRWSEEFVAELPGIDPHLCEEILAVHRSPVIPAEQKSYLIAALGCKGEAAEVPGCWSGASRSEEFTTRQFGAALADALAGLIAAESRQRQLQEQLLQEKSGSVVAERAQAALIRRCEECAKEIEELQRQLADRDREVANREVARECAKETEKLQRQLADRDREVARMHAELAPGRAAMERLTAIMNSYSWRVAQWLVRTRHRLVPSGSFRARIAGGAWRAAWRLRQDRRDVGHSVVDWLQAAQGAATPVATEMSYATSDTVNILTTTFFNLDGEDMFCGGAERYLIELARLIRGLGYRPAVYQCANRDWVRWYNDLQVHGIGAGGNMELLNRRFHECVPPAALTIYFAFHLATPNSHPRSLGISHGIWWDHAEFQYPAAEGRAWQQKILRCIGNCRHLVSVDTNTINWVRATDSEQSGKFTYIPNFVDPQVFAPAGEDGDPDHTVVLFPRRLYGPRGLWLLTELIPYFCERYPEVEFHLVGKGGQAEIEVVSQLQSRWGNRVQHYYLEPEDMHQAYRRADVTLIPTVASEGTSLSCLEAMASANAVIATNVGGLPDLVLDGYNGLLIEPTVQGLKEALERLLDNPGLRRRFQENARGVSLSFSQTTWESRWRRQLEALLPVRQEEATTEDPGAWRFVHPKASGIAWGRMKQRPQQLFQALAELGQQAFFVSDDDYFQVPAAERAAANRKHPCLHVVSSDRELCVTKPVVYLYYSYLYKTLGQWRDRTVVYDILDDPVIHEASDRAAGQAADDCFAYYHEKLLKEADLVLTSSAKLYAAYRGQRPDLLLVPNAVRVEDFAVQAAQRPADLPPPGSKIMGYYGALCEWFDFDLLAKVARARPDYRFVLIGLTTLPDKVRQLVRENANIAYLGEKCYEELPSYLAHFDVAMIPFVVNHVTNAVSPLKLFEYMAGGRPVVSTNLFECRKHEQVLVADCAADFASHLDRAVTLASDGEYQEELRTIAAKNSWRARAAMIVEALDRRQAAGEQAPAQGRLAQQQVA